MIADLEVDKGKVTMVVVVNKARVFVFGSPFCQSKSKEACFVATTTRDT